MRQSLRSFADGCESTLADLVGLGTDLGPAVDLFGCRVPQTQSESGADLRLAWRLLALIPLSSSSRMAFIRVPIRMLTR